MTEASRARYPDHDGFVERDGVRVFYEVYGEGDTTLLFLPAWAVCYSRLWKAQIPYFARHHRVVVFDGRGNGRSDRPANPEAYGDDEIIADALAVLDATNTARAIIVGASAGGWWGTMLAGLHPERVQAAVLMCPGTSLGDPLPGRLEAEFDEVLETEEGWRGKWNRDYWLRDYPGFARWFAERCISERHSTRQVECMAEWILETTPETLLATMAAPGWKKLEREGESGSPEPSGAERALALYERIECPTLVIHGDCDEVIAHNKGVAVADAIGAPLITLEGSGHAPQTRIPVKVNLLIRNFVESVRTGTAALPVRGIAA